MLSGMILTLLLALLVVAAFGFACSVWAARGGPRWTRIASTVTVGAANAVSATVKSNRNSGNRNQGDDGV
ncbi:hypothetical protein [Streptomyces sp. NPDC052225]|uniref:hypothetical protein n=1 Tax=Streptomyces sp. NPDC052225 TaxID=3154949 RepID=UPI0034143284